MSENNQKAVVSDPWNDFLNFNVDSSIAKPGEIIFCHIAGVDYDRKGKIIGYLLENKKLKGNPYISVDDYEKYYSPDDEVIFVKVVTQDDEDGNTIVDAASAAADVRKQQINEFIDGKIVVSVPVVHETDKAFILQPLSVFEGQNWSINKRDSKYLTVGDNVEVILQRTFPNGGVQCSNRAVRLQRKQQVIDSYPIGDFHRVKLGRIVKGSYVGKFKDGTKWSIKRSEAMPNAKFFSGGIVQDIHGETVILACKTPITNYLHDYLDGKVIDAEVFYNDGKGIVLANVVECPALIVKVYRASLNKSGEKINVVLERTVVGKTTAKRV